MPLVKYPSTLLHRLTARVSKHSERRVQQLALTNEVTVQTLIIQGLSRMFAESGLPPLDEDQESILKADIDADLKEYRKSHPRARA